MDHMAGRRFLVHFARFLVFLIALSPLAVVASETAPHPALWKISNGGSTVYVLGSLHILPPKYNWRAPEIEAAMRATDVFVFEVPIDDEALQHQKDFIIHNGILPRGTSLRAVLNRIEFQTYSRILEGTGLKPEIYTRFRPWLAAVLVGLAYVHGRDIATLTGVDDDLIDYAQSRGKELRYLETIEQQMQLLMFGDDIAQVKALKRMISSLPNSRTHSAEYVESWTQGDTTRFYGMIDSDFQGHEDARDLLLSNRNRVWLEPVKTLLAPGSRTAMITVGAAHLGGPKGLLTLLCQEGFEVQRVGANGAPDSNICGPRA